MKTRTRRIGALLLTLVMVFTMLPASALAAKGPSEKLVSSLAEVYGGDAERAREDLEALYAAGIIDENGDMVALDVRVDGASVELDALARRIAAGETVGAITVNGNDAAPEQIVQISQVNAMLELLRLLDRDVEITDEHVANFEALITALADGSIDLGDVLRTGTLSMNSLRGTLMGDDDSGDLELDGDGKFTAPMLDGADYEAEHLFSAGGAATWYTDDAHRGIAADGVVTLSVSDPANTENNKYAPGETITVTATLSKAQALPVSFDWKAVSGALGVSQSGTVTWTAGDAADKSFTVTIPAQTEGDLWQGDRGLVVSVSNVRNAALSSGEAAWTRSLPVRSEDVEAIKATYIKTLQYNSTDLSQWKKTNTNSAGCGVVGYDHYQVFFVLAEDLPGEAPFTVERSYNSGDAIWCDFGLVSPNTTLTEDNSNGNIASTGTPVYFIYGGVTPNQFVSGNNTGKGSGVQTVEVTDNGVLSCVSNGKAYLVLSFWNLNSSSSTPTASVEYVKITAPRPNNTATITGVSVPAGTYYGGEVVPVTVTVDSYIVADENTVLTVNGVDCPLLDSALIDESAESDEAAGYESKKFTFGYTVQAVDTGSVNVTAIAAFN